MSVPVTDPIDQFVVVGGEPTFTYNWLINSESEIVVQRQNNSVSPGVITTLTLTTDYTVQGVGNAGGGTITPVGAQSPVVSGDVWTLFRDSKINRPQDFAISGAFAAVTINQQLDNLTRIAQDRKRDVDEAVKKDPAVGDALNPLIPQMISGRALKFAESSPGNFILTMSQTDPDDGSVKTVAGLFATVITVSSNFVIQPSQDGFEVRVDTSAGDVDIFLPFSSILDSDFRAGIVKITSDSNVVNVKVQGGDTINGVTSDVVQSTQFLRLIYVLDQSSAAYVFAVDQVGLQSVAQDTSPQYGAPMDSNGFSLNESQGANVASATQPNIWVGDGNTIRMTGTVPVQDFPDAPRIGAKVTIIVVADGLLFKSGLGITLQGGADILAKAGDRFEVYADAVNAFSGIFVRNITPNPFSNQLFHVRHEVANGVEGGTFNSGDWRTRLLNTVKTNEIVGASFANNRSTLPPGKYYLEASAPAFQVNRHQTKLRDVTGGADILIGSSAISGTADSAMPHSFVRGRFSVSTTSAFELQHQCQTTGVADGFGLASSFNVGEVYADVRIWKVG